MTHIIQKALDDGVTMTLTATGQIEVTGDQPAIDKWLPAIREHKPAIVAALSGADPQQTAEAVHEHLEERAAIMEYDGGLPRPEAEYQAKAVCRVYEYRLSDSPFRWLVMIAPGCDLAEAERTLRNRFLARFVEVRLYASRGRP